MNKRIFKTTLLVGLVALILSSIFSFFLYYKTYKVSSEEDLTSLISLIDSTINFEEDKIKYLENISKFDKNTRITYIDSKNNIIFDSYGDVPGIKGHINSEEFEDSIKTGIYNPNKYRKNAFEDIYYNAFKLNDGSILRVSKETESIFKLFLKVLPANILIGLVVLLISKRFSKATTTEILRFIEADIETPRIDTDKIPEISPIMYEIKSQRDVIERQLEEIKIEQDTIKIIIENMEEGFLMISRNKTILLINKAALDFLNVKKNVINKNILYLTRDEEIVNSIEVALKGTSSEGVIDSASREIKYYSNPVYLKNEIAGSILFFIDETEQIRSQKIREEFSANVSHELKTPLTSIYGFSELLKNKMITSEKDKEEIIGNIYSESKRLLDLTEDIMKISKLEGRSEVSKTIINLRVLSEEIISVFKSSASNKNIRLSVKGEGTIVANETMMWEMLANLVENAIKYNVQDGEVTIELKQSKNIEISVLDTGIGIPVEKQKRIFERFYRVDESRNKKSGGTGLGLSIVKHIVKSHGGEIVINSKEKVGTEIKIFLPIDTKIYN
ncbi:two-component system, OmpR family, phosphate regulon sensor histidine kinase PhoR [Anaerosphaera aminiphila DSM 21120]|uniref:histidine kinase n=1 Tax=Anaerosphaera aminiphila DSM 21120 TaxID=1120995 RepID=A0A1M5QMQ2_9FIRM|nr:ATP-binding protein [Anaerosphaera aminiphila]SHH15079.1 two-component system, OmpR family, phosphate regulon sensor histidine kinase PhoR [Anaerosphaera aminiphila DSM 21120]